MNRHGSRPIALAVFFVGAILLPSGSFADDIEATGTRLKAAVATGRITEEQARTRFADYMKEAAGAEEDDDSASRRPKKQTAAVRAGPSPAKTDGGHVAPGQPDYYALISEKNLFRPLGWEPPDPSPKYALLLTAIAQPPVDKAPNADADFRAPPLDEGPPEPSRQNRALITDLGSGGAFYRTVGEKVGEMTVTDIQLGRITLRTDNGEMTELAFPHMSKNEGKGSSTRTAGGASPKAHTGARSTTGGETSTARGSQKKARSPGKTGADREGDEAEGKKTDTDDNDDEEANGEGEEESKDEEEDKDDEEEEEEKEEEESRGGVYIDRGGRR